MNSKPTRFFRKLRDYITNDLKEIAFPSSMPNPPDYVPPPPRTAKNRLRQFLAAFQKYKDSWDPKKLAEQTRLAKGEVENVSDKSKEEEEESFKEIMEGFGKATQGGARTIVPYLQHVYRTRAASYRDALKKFIEGYKEGFREVSDGVDGVQKSMRSGEATGARGEQQTSQSGGEDGGFRINYMDEHNDKKS